MSPPRPGPRVAASFVGWVKGRRTHRAAARTRLRRAAEGSATSVNGGSAEP